MTTRYSLPPNAQQTDTARGARLLAALVLVVTVIALSVLVAVMPTRDPGLAAVPDRDAAPAPVVIGA
jgi:hypothetical protein